MRHEGLYLTDIIEAAGHIAEFTAGVDFEAFQQSELLRRAVVHKLSVMGEAAGRLSDELRLRTPRYHGLRSLPSATSWSTRILGSMGDSMGRRQREQVAQIFAAESNRAECE